MSESAKVGDYFIERFFLGVVASDSTTWLKLKPDFIKLDSIILYDPNIKLNYKTSRIRGLEPSPENYGLVRGYAISKSEPHAVITLAKYRCPEDKRVIIDWLEDAENQYFGIWAAREFPDPAFEKYKNKIEVTGIYADFLDEAMNVEN